MCKSDIFPSNQISYKVVLMNTSQEQLLRILNLVIRGGVPTPESFSSINGEELYAFAVRQDVCAFLYPILNKYPEEIKLDEHIIHRWKSTFLFLFTRQLSMTKGIKDIFEIFRANDIPAISLKGLALKQVYPQPELRNMGDLDLLIDEKDMQKSIELMCTLGYQPNSINMNDPDYMHIDMYRQGSFPVELHRTLWHPNHMKDRDNRDWFNHIWENKRVLKVDGIQFTALSLEDELINMVIHIARHLKHSNANLRQLCDFTLFLNANRSNMDSKYIDQTITAMGLIIFYQNLITTCHLYFELKVPISNGGLEKNKSEALIKYILNSNLYKHTKGGRECSTLPSPHAFARNITCPSLAIVWVIGQKFMRKVKIILISISFTKKLLKSLEPFRSRARFLRSIGLNLRY